jgi:hypothetical protein
LNGSFSVSGDLALCLMMIIDHQFYVLQYKKASTMGDSVLGERAICFQEQESST